MAEPRIAAAMERATAALRRRPQAGLHDDAPAAVRWAGALRTAARSPAGAEVTTDMPAELGGDGSAATPGWLLRTALASCLVTRIAMEAAAQGIGLQTLDVEARSRSDLRGLLGLADVDGAAVSPGPLAISLHVRLSAPGVDAERLHALVQQAGRCSPMTAAIEQALAVGLQVEVAG